MLADMFFHLLMQCITSISFPIKTASARLYSFSPQHDVVSALCDTNQPQAITPEKVIECIAFTERNRRVHRTAYPAWRKIEFGIGVRASPPARTTRHTHASLCVNVVGLWLLHPHRAWPQARADRGHRHALIPARTHTQHHTLFN